MVGVRCPFWTLWNVRNKFTIEGGFPTNPADGLYKMTVYLQVWKPLARRGDRQAVEWCLVLPTGAEWCQVVFGVSRW
jgi:hypothetical protein